MGEVLFVLKSFLITCAVVYCLQFKIGNQTADEKLNQFLQKGALTHFLKDATAGATRITASTYNAVKDGEIAMPFKAVKQAEDAKQELEDARDTMIKKAEEIEYE